MSASASYRSSNLLLPPVPVDLTCPVHREDSTLRAILDEDHAQEPSLVASLGNRSPHVAGDHLIGVGDQTFDRIASRPDSSRPFLASLFGVTSPEDFQLYPSIRTLCILIDR